MTHHDSGHYRKKHPPGTSAAPVIAEALREVQSNGRVSCSAAHAIAAELGFSPGRVGEAMDLMELRIGKCQLGLFGYHPDKKIVRPAESIPFPLEKAIVRAAPSGKLTCADAWSIADAQEVKKLTVAAAVEKLGFRITGCQLGAF